MLNRVKLAIWLIPILFGVSASLAFAEEKLSYTVGPRDTLEISVWQHTELNRTVTVRPDGKISFSLVGDVNVIGLTPAEVDEVVTRRLSKHIQSPEVTVIVTDIRSIGSGQILILGEAARPGAYPIVEGTTALEAIAKAGSYTESAALHKVTVMRRPEAGAPKVIKVNLEKVIAKGDTSKDIVLKPDDVVYLPKKTSKWEVFDRYFIRGILPIATLIIIIDELEED